jgi:plastocyanin
MNPAFPLKKKFATAAVWLCFGGAVSGFAATANVSVGSGGLVFTPATTSIAVNDLVIWTWGGPASIPHSTTSGTVVITATSTNKVPNGLWDSGVAIGPHSFTNIFSSAGSFPYYCQVHYTNNMTGTIIVTGLPPVISITNPVSGALFIAPANVTIQAAATDPNNGVSVTNVQFLVGQTVLTNKTAAPFSAVTNNLAADGYILSAIASDSAGLKATNSVNIIVDAPPMLTITNPPGGITLSAPASVTIQVSASDSDGTVTNVQFLVGSTVLGNVPTAPFSAVTNNLAAGSYTFSTVASDNNGVTATNAIAISVVTPLPLVMSAPQLSSVNFQFSYAANPGLSYIVQLATNLDAPDWIPIFTNTAASNPVVFVHNHATNNPAFYRVGLLPNP